MNNASNIADIHIQSSPTRPLSQSKANRDLQRADAGGDWEASSLARAVAQSHGVTAEELFHHSRSRAPIATTRQIAMYLMHVLLGRTLTEVGEYYGRDRTTVAYGCARIEDLRDDATFDCELTELEDRIWKFISKSSNDVAGSAELDAPSRPANDQ